MNFVKGLNIFGLDVTQISCLTFDVPPTKYTEGEFGMLGMDTLGNLYKCTGVTVDVTGKIYNWEKVNSSSGTFKRWMKSDWERINPILSDGELGFVAETNQFKVGNGTSKWNELDFVSTGSGGDIGELKITKIIGGNANGSGN